MDISETFAHHNIRQTAVRMLIYRSMLKFHDTFSLADLEVELDTVDKSTIFRALEVFHAAPPHPRNRGWKRCPEVLRVSQ